MLLVYSQLDGIFRDKAEQEGEAAFANLFSRRQIKSNQSATVREFTDLVADSETMTGTEPEFFLHVRDAMTEGVDQTTLDDKSSRHGVLHGRVLGYGTRRTAAQAFAFLAASLELLLALQDEPLMTKEEADTVPIKDVPDGLQFILFATAFYPVRAVYLTNRGKQKDLLLAIEDDAEGS